MLLPDTCDSQVNERSWWGRGPFFIRVSGGVRALGITYPRRCRECYARRATLPARFPQVARARALCVPRCLKSFPISHLLHTITPTSTALHRCCCTPCHCSRIRLSDELASGLTLGLDCLGFSRGRRNGEIHTAFPERRLEPNREKKKGIGGMEDRGKRRERMRSKGDTGAVGEIMSSKYVVKSL